MTRLRGLPESDSVGSDKLWGGDFGGSGDGTLVCLLDRPKTTSFEGLSSRKRLPTSLDEPSPELFNLDKRMCPRDRGRVFAFPFPDRSKRVSGFLEVFERGSRA